MKLQIFKTLGFLAIAAFVNGCSSSESGPAQPAGGYPTLSGQEFAVLSGDAVSTGNQVEGSGTLLFRLPLPDDDNNYDFSFDLKEDSSVTLVTLSDPALTTGIELTLARKEGSLRVILKDGAESTDVTEELPTISATSTVNIPIDVHEHGHIIVFVNGKEYPFAFDSRPKGKIWGLRLANATVRGAKIGVAKHKD